MLSSNNISQLIEPVLQRAVANQVYPNLNLADRWAEFVLEKLEVAPYLKQSARANSDQYLHSLQRCKWIDEELLTFLKHSPCAQVVELHAGLSTRFHRVSHASDWPRFSWVAVDKFDVAECSGYVFPELDHHLRVIDDLSKDEWLSRIHWDADNTLMVICNDESSPADLMKIHELIEHLRHHFSSRSGAVHLIITHSVPQLSLLLNTFAPTARVIAQCHNAPRPTFLGRRMFDAIMRLFPSKPKVQVAHIVLNANEGKSLEPCTL